MRYPGPDEDSESNSLWDIPLEDENGADHAHMFYDSTLSEYSPHVSPDEDEETGLRDPYQHPIRPTTPEPQQESHELRQRNPGPPLRFGSVVADNIPGPSRDLPRIPRRRERTNNSSHPHHLTPTNSHNNIHDDSSSSFEYFVPMISINVPSRQNQRLSRARRNSARYGSNNSVSRYSDHSELGRPSFRIPDSPSRIPIPIIHNPLFRSIVSNGVGTGDDDQQGRNQAGSNAIHDVDMMRTGFVNSPQTSGSDAVFSQNFRNVEDDPPPNSSLSYLNHSNPAVARFIHPPMTPAQPLLTESSTQTESWVPTSQNFAGQSSLQIDPSHEESLRGFSDEELAFDNFIHFTESPSIKYDRGTLGTSSSLPRSAHYTNPAMPLSHSCIADREHFRCESAENSSNTSTNSTSGLFMKSREATSEQSIDLPSNSSEDEDSDTSTPQREEEAPTSSLKQQSLDDGKVITTDGEIPGPSSNTKEEIVSAELSAELVLDNNTILKNGKCKLTFSGLHVNDLTNLLNQNVSIQLEQGKVVVLTVSQAPPHGMGEEDHPRPIYRKISRYMGGQVMQTEPEQGKKVSFCDKLVNEREFAETESAVSPSAEPVFEWSAEGQEEEDDILSGLEEFEED